MRNSNAEFGKIRKETLEKVNKKREFFAELAKTSELNYVERLLEKNLFKPIETELEKKEDKIGFFSLVVKNLKYRSVIRNLLKNHDLYRNIITELKQYKLMINKKDLKDFPQRTVISFRCFSFPRKVYSKYSYIDKNKNFFEKRNVNLYKEAYNYYLGVNDTDEGKEKFGVLVTIAPEIAKIVKFKKGKNGNAW